MNKAIFITVRTGSSRLTSKSILKIRGKHTIQYVIDSVKKSQHADKIVLCTTEKSEDNILAVIAFDAGIECFRGSELNKFKRWAGAAEKFNIDFFVTADGDDLFYDAGLADLVFQQYERTNVDFINGQGLYVDTYGIKASALQNVVDSIPESVEETEPFDLKYYFDTTQIGHQLYRTAKLKNVPDIYKKKKIRMTLDYDDDFKFFDTVISDLSKNFTFRDVLLYLKNNKEVVDINIHCDFDWKQNQLNQSSVKSSKGWRFENNERQYIDEVLSRGFSAGEDGSMGERLETLFAKYHNQKYAIGFNSGTSTLHAALDSFGIKAGDEVLVPALTPAMCGYAIWHTGAIPVFVDVLEDTFLMNPDDIEKKITTNTKAIMVVHIYGLMCDMDSIMKIANRHKLLVLEDCAQCFLATDDKDRVSGTIGDVGSWSFENSKHLSCGDGGIVTTDNKILAKHIRQFGGVGFKNITAGSGKVRISRDKFQDPNWERHNIMAYNYRMPELCAAVALSQVENIKTFCDKRVQAGNAYRNAIQQTGTDLLIPQYIPEGYSHSYYTFAALFNGNKYGIKWQEFRQTYIANGGDGIYAAWKTQNDEPAFKNNHIGRGETPVAKQLQKNLMQFTTNQQNLYEIEIQVNALRETISDLGY